MPSRLQRSFQLGRARRGFRADAPGGIDYGPIVKAMTTAYWPMESVTGPESGEFDFSPNALSLAHVNAPAVVTGHIAGPADKARKFVRATDQYLTQGATWTQAQKDKVAAGDRTFGFALWAFFPTLAGETNNRTIIAKDDSGGLGRDYTFSRSGPGANEGKINFVVFVPTNVTKVVTSTALTSLDAWHFIIVWHDAALDTVNVSIDGGAIKSTATGGALQADLGVEFRVGRPIFASNNLEGTLDAIWMFDDAPTEGLIEHLWNDGVGVELIGLFL